jgi:hypothetical protein
LSVCLPVLPFAPKGKKRYALQRSQGMISCLIILPIIRVKGHTIDVTKLRMSRFKEAFIWTDISEFEGNPIKALSFHLLLKFFLVKNKIAPILN